MMEGLHLIIGEGEGEPEGVGEPPGGKVGKPPGGGGNSPPGGGNSVGICVESSHAY